MNKNMNLPAEYAVLSEEEMTYTQGGSDIGGFASTAATVVGAVVLGASYIWGISVSKDWLNKKSNREGNLFTVLGRAFDDIGADMKPCRRCCRRGYVQVRSQLCPGCRFQHHGGGSGSPERCSADPVSRESGIPGLFSVTCGVCCTVQ